MYFKPHLVLAAWNKNARLQSPKYLSIVVIVHLFWNLKNKTERVKQNISCLECFESV